MRAPQLPYRIKLVVLSVLSCFTGYAQALPNGAEVVNGSASLQQNGNLLTITNSSGTAINWQGFSIGANETVRFIQPSSTSNVLNRVVGSDPSSLLGLLQSNGRVWLINPAGILVGAGARIDVAGFVASTLPVRTEDFLAGKLLFQGAGGAVQNQGTITTPSGGHIYLIGSTVENSGTLQAPGGTVALAGGDKVQIGDTATPGVVLEVGSGGSVSNTGQIVADAGRVGLVGALVKNSGLIDASSVEQQGGRVYLRASGQLEQSDSGKIDVSGTSGGSASLEAGDKALVGGRIEAQGKAGDGGNVQVLADKVALLDNASVNASGANNGGTVLLGGDWQGGNPAIRNANFAYFGSGARIHANAGQHGHGGKVVVWSNDTTRAYGSVSARGGALSGDGGKVEISGKQTLVFQASADTSAPFGATGMVLLDPSDVTIGAASTGGIQQSTVGPHTFFDKGTGNSTISWADLNSLLSTSHVFVTTDGSGATKGGTIQLASSNSYNSSKELNLYAHGDIFAIGVNVVNSGVGAINFTAGWNGQWQGTPGSSLPTNTTTAGTGSIDIKGSIINTSGDMTWKAGNALNVVGGTGGNQVAQVFAGGTQTITTKSVTVQAGDNSNGNAANLASTGNQTINTTNLVVQGGGDSGAFTGNFAQLAATGSGSTQTINISASGSVLISGGKGSGMTDLKSGSGAVLCSNCVSDNWASLSSVGSQTVNFATGGVTPTLIINGGLAGVRNYGAFSAATGQTITGRPDIVLNGGTGGSTALGSAANLSNGALITNTSSTAQQTISAASITLNALGDANTAGGAHLWAPLQSIDVSGNVTLNGGASSETTRGATALIAYSDSNDLTLKVGGDLSMTGGSKSNSGAQIGTSSASSKTRADIAGNATVTDGSSGASFAWNDATVTVGGNYNAKGSTLTQNFNNASAFNLLAKGHIVFDGAKINNGGSGALNLTAGWNGQLSGTTPVNATSTGVGSIQVKNSTISMVGAMDWRAGEKIELFGGSGANQKAATVKAGGTMQITAPTLTIQAGDGGNDNSASLSSNGDQTVTATHVSIRGGGDSGAFAGNFAELAAFGSGTQTLNIANNGSVEIAAGRGTGLTNYSDPAGVQQCSNCTSANWAHLLSNGSQTLNFATGSATPTLTLRGGSAGIANQANLAAANGQTITGRPALFLFGGTGGSSSALTNSDGTPYFLSNHATIFNGAGGGNQSISASSITLEGLGNASTVGGAFIASLRPQLIDVSGNVTQLGGDSNAAGAQGQFGPRHGSAAVIISNDLTLKVGGNLALSGGSGSDSPAVLGAPDSGIAQVTVAGSFTRSGDTRVAPSTRDGGGTDGGGGGTTDGGGSTDQTGGGTTPTTGESTDEEFAEEFSEELAEVVDPEMEMALLAAWDEGYFEEVAADSDLTFTALEEGELTEAEPSASPKETTAETETAPPPASPSDEAPEQASKPAGPANMQALATMISQRREQRTELYKEALTQLRSDPTVADVPDCAAGAAASELCVRTDTQAKVSLSAVSSIAPTRKRIALLIGNNAYTDKRVGRLATPVADVQSVAEQLRSKFNFETRILTNATKADLFREMNKLAGEVEQADSVFVMYAGHGYEIKDTKQGYWLPVDAKADAAQSWVSNNDIGRFLKAIPARQVMLVSDSCFSGSLTREQSIKEQKGLERTKILRERSVTALSSGGDEPVLDSGAGGHSVFAGHLLNTLGRLKKDITGFELYRGLYSAVLQEFPQAPQYGGVRSAGHTGEGDYLIDVKKQP